MLKLLSVKILISSGSVENTSAMAKPAPFGNDLPEGNATCGFVKCVKQAYPIYHLSFNRNLTLVLNWLEPLENVHSMGHQGLFLNNDIYTSMKMSLEAVHNYSR